MRDPAKILTVRWCPSCGREFGSPVGIPPGRHRRPNSRSLCDGATEKLRYELVTPRLPTIPHGRFRARQGMEPEFVRMEEFGNDWFLLGPDSVLRPGEVVWVTRFSTKDRTLKLVGEVLAERIVGHRGGGSTRFVVTRFDPVIDEPRDNGGPS